MRGIRKYIAESAGRKGRRLWAVLLPSAWAGESSGAKVGDASGLLEGDYADGRRLAQFSSMDEVRMKQARLQRAIKKWLALLDKN